MRNSVLYPKPKQPNSVRFACPEKGNGKDKSTIGPVNAVGKEENGKRTKIIDFCFDSGAVKTILRPKDADKRNIVPTKDTGRNFRAANGGLIPNLGAVELKGKATNNANMAVVAQVAEVTKPCLLYTSPSPRDLSTSRMPSSA